MKCPQCQQLMERGVIQSSQEIAWHRKKHLIARASFHKGSVVLSAMSFWRGSASIAYLCRECELVIIDYHDGKNDLNRS